MSGTATMLDTKTFVNGVAKRFEVEYKITVTDLARYELTEPAVQHEEEISRELAEGKISYPALEGAIMEVLRNARDIALEWGQEYIDEKAVRASMELRCPYIPWC